MKKIIVALIGKAGSGKDTILNRICLQFPNYHKIVSCTTRPMRENEKDGEDYHFLSQEEFTKKLLDGDLLEATEFNDWFYGTLKSDLVDCGINIGVFNPEGYERLTEFYNEDIYVIGFYIKCNDKERLLRQLNREESPDVDEIVRRYKTDKLDFITLDEGSLRAISLTNEE